MKNTLVIPILAFAVFLLGACSDSQSNTISVAELTDRENAILSTTSENSLVFDFNTTSDFQEVSVWVEKYESGSLVDEKLSYLTTVVEQSGSIIFAPSFKNQQKQMVLNIGVGSNGGVSSINGYDTNSNELDNMASVWGNIQEKKALDKGEVVLASICYATGDLISFTNDFYEDPESHMNDLNRCEVAYLLKTEFK